MTTAAQCAQPTMAQLLDAIRAKWDNRNVQWADGELEQRLAWAMHRNSLLLDRVDTPDARKEREGKVLMAAELRAMADAITNTL